MNWKRIACGLVVAGLAGCATVPTGPRVAVMPAPGKPLDLFAAEDRYCRQYAEQSIGLTPNQANAQSFVDSAALGTVIGAAAGAAVGGHHGAQTGAAAGLVTGSAVGAGQGAYASGDAQRRYDIAYEQCMYAKGNQLPGYPYRQPGPPAEYRSAPPPYPPPPPPSR
jgi:hypothetical protein